MHTISSATPRPVLPSPLPHVHMYSTPRSASARRFASASATLGLLLAAQGASAATQYWDPGLTPTANSGKGSGGSGTFTTAGANWSNGATDAVLVTSNATSGSTAGFAGAAGTVTIASTVALSAASLSIETSGYTIGTGTSSSTINVSPNANEAGGILVGSGVTGTSINVASIKLASGASGVTIALTNTDLVNFGNTTVYLSGSRTTVISNSSTSGTTTFAKLAVTDKTAAGGTWPNAKVQLDQGNLVINSLAGASSSTGALAAYGGNSTTASFPTVFQGSTTGTLTINGNNTKYVNNVIAANQAPLTFTFSMTNGTLALGDNNALGSRNASNAATGNILNITAGTLAASGGARTIGNTVTAATFAIGGTNDITLTGNMTFSGGNRTLTVSNTGATTLSGNVFIAADNTTGRRLTVAGAGNLTISGVIANNNSGNTLASDLTLNSTGGILTLSNANTYTGNTTVSNGTLLVNGSTAAGSLVNVSSGAILGGNGTIGGATTVNGTLAPGNSPGVLTFTGNLTLAGTSTTAIEISGIGRGTAYDGIDLTGDGTKALSYGGTLSMSFGAPITAGVYDLFALGAVTHSGDFAAVNAAGSEVNSFSGLTITPGTGWDATLVDNQTTPGSWSLSFDNTTGDLTIAAIPEPSTCAALFGLGVLGLAALRRRRANKAQTLAA